MFGRLWDGYKRVDPVLSAGGNIISLAVWLGLPVGALMAYLSAQLNWFWGTYQWAGVVGVGLITWFLIGVTINLFRNVTGSRTINAYLIVAGLACIVMVAALVGYSRSQAATGSPAVGNLEPTKHTTEQFLRNAALMIEPDGKVPLALGATSAVTAQRLRVFVDYSSYRSGWMSRLRVPIGEITNPVDGVFSKTQLIFKETRQNGGTNELWWGQHGNSHPVSGPEYNGVTPVTPTRGRVVIMDDAGKVQFIYFELLRATDPKRQPFTILQGPAVEDWINKWEAEG
jgi:hypothetical protein